MSIFYNEFLLTFFMFYVIIVSTLKFHTYKKGQISMSRMNLDALKAVDVNGVPIYQVPILEQYIPKLMKNIL